MLPTMPRVNWKRLARPSKSSNFTAMTHKTSQDISPCEVFRFYFISNSDALWYIKKTEDI